MSARLKKNGWGVLLDDRGLNLRGARLLSIASTSDIFICFDCPLQLSKEGSAEKKNSSRGMYCSAIRLPTTVFEKGSTPWHLPVSRPRNLNNTLIDLES